MKNKVCFKKRTVILLTMLFLASCVGVILLNSKNKVSTSSQSVSVPKSTLQAAPNYPLGTYYIYAREGQMYFPISEDSKNFFKFDEKTKTVTNLPYLGSNSETNAVISNDKKYFFVLKTDIKERNNMSGINGEVWKMDLNGNMLEKLTNTESAVERFFVSPDESRISYECYKEGLNERYVLNLIDKKIVSLPTFDYEKKTKLINNYYLSQWVDSMNVGLYNNDGPTYKWNIKTHEYNLNKSIKLDRSFWDSPDKKYSVSIDNVKNNFIAYYNKNVLFSNTLTHANSIPIAGWTLDNRFLVFFMDQSNWIAPTNKFASVVLIDTAEKKIMEYSMESLNLPNKDFTIDTLHMENLTMPSGKAYFIIRPTAYASEKKVDFGVQLWVFDVQKKAFEKINNSILENIGQPTFTAWIQQ
ncbi:MAG: hypothetical protein NTV98_05170 [Candidatus Roizmanbacteria bacterium]|nr:hypothetical protein [Candidatus Roizmanbacteria bacterium]